MIKRNSNYTNLAKGYLFPEIAKRRREYQAAHPEAKIISLGIGNTTEPLTPHIVEEMKKFITNVNCTASPLGLPMWVFRYSATSEQVEKDGNIFYVPKFSMKKNADGSPMFINPKFKDQIKGVFESWTAMMSQINKFDLDNADEMASADTEGAIF